MLINSTNTELDDTLGDTLIGVILSSCLYGITIIHTYTFFSRSTDDPRALKCMIALLWLLDTSHEVFISHAVYTYAVTDFNNGVALLWVIWSSSGAVMASSLNNHIVRSFFCYRIWVLSHIPVTDTPWRRSKVVFRWLLPTMILITSLMGCVGGFAYAVASIQLKTYDALESRVTWLLMSTFAVSLVSDGMITVSLCMVLGRHRRGLASLRASNTLKTLMIYAIKTGGLSCACSLVCVISYAIKPGEAIYITSYFLLPRVMLNSLLGTLNGRKAIREELSKEITSHRLEWALQPATGGTLALTQLHEGTGQVPGPNLVREHVTLSV
ncbi:hypothetical protein BD413DRAFT_186098 [Trametes elegans]|nr:hypothetical protein BD413DRAFT_186098 [Trametes elegans]